MQPRWHDRWFDFFSFDFRIEFGRKKCGQTNYGKWPINRRFSSEVIWFRGRFHCEIIEMHSKPSSTERSKNSKVNLKQVCVYVCVWVWWNEIKVKEKLRSTATEAQMTIFDCLSNVHRFDFPSFGWCPSNENKDGKATKEQSDINWNVARWRQLRKRHQKPFPFES